MWIHLSNESKAPLYEQLKSQIRQQIIDGTLKGNSELPSIRTLAKQIKTSVITVKRAYSDLEIEGYIYTKSGRGTFVKERNQEELNQIAMKDFQQKAIELIEYGRSLGFSDSEIQQLLQTIQMGEE